MSLIQTRLLLVDDEPLVLEMFETVLSNTGFSVTLTHSAKEALKYLKMDEFDVLVTDVLLEDYDGFELHCAAKKLYPKIATVLITGAPNSIDSSRASHLGISYLSKPLGFENLLNCIDIALKKEDLTLNKVANLSY